MIAEQPENAGAWGFAGLCEFQLKKYEPALGDLMKARELHVASNKELGAVVRYHAAILLTRFQQFELSQKVLSEFTAEGNDNPKVIEALGLSTLRIPLLPDELPAGRREQVLLAGQGRTTCTCTRWRQHARASRNWCAAIRTRRTRTTRLA